MIKKYIIILLFICIPFLLSGCVKSDKEKAYTDQVNSSNVFKLLVMDSQIGEPYEPTRLAMLETLKKEGYIEGKNLIIKKYVIENDIDKGKQILQDELKNNYDVIFVNGTVMTTAAKEVVFDKNEHKVVFASVTDPVSIGVIKDFKNPPTANFTGICYPIPVKSRINFIMRIMPNLKKIGLVYADMPQSHSYRKWLEDLFQNDPKFKDIEIVFRKVPFVKGSTGSQEMAELARPIIKEIDSQVDVFLSPNDQMGVQPYYAKMLYEEATKPLVGLGHKDVMDQWGATMSMFPLQSGVGVRAGNMIVELFKGAEIIDIIPEWPDENGVAFDLDKIEKFRLEVPIDLLRLAKKNIVQTK